MMAAPTAFMGRTGPASHSSKAEYKVRQRPGNGNLQAPPARRDHQSGTWPSRRMAVGQPRIALLAATTRPRRRRRRRGPAQRGPRAAEAFHLLAEASRMEGEGRGQAKNASDQPARPCRRPTTSPCDADGQAQCPVDAPGAGSGRVGRSSQWSIRARTARGNRQQTSSTERRTRCRSRRSRPSRGPG